MALQLVLLFTILAFALMSTGQSVSSPTTTSTTSPKSCPHPETSMSTAIEHSITRTTSISTTTPKSCPHSGYQLYPELNCYKTFPEERTWSKARDQCVRDGGDLMVMETERERQDVYIPLYNKNVRWSSFPWMGVYKPEGEVGWMTVNGEPALSSWWWPGEPNEDAALKCTLADDTGLLWNSKCATTRTFICEISL